MADSLGRRDALRITAVAGLAAAFGGGLGVAVLRQLGLRRVSATRVRMGTVVTLTVVHDDGDEARSWIEAGFAEMERLEALLSRHRPETPVGLLNRTGRLDGAPPELVEVLSEAQALARRTDGAFDVTVAPVVSLYEASFAAGGPPSARALDEALRLVGYERLHVDGDRVGLVAPGMAVTLDGIAKGYIVDRTVEVLAARGAERVLVDAGGDIATAGSGSVEEPWTVGVQDPRGDALLGVLRLAGQSIATSGDYLNAFTEDRRLHHIVDPRTGRSPDEVSAVSVVADRAQRADGLSTALMVLGVEVGRTILEDTPGVEGLIVAKDGRRFQSSGLARLVT